MNCIQLIVLAILKKFIVPFSRFGFILQNPSRNKCSEVVPFYVLYVIQYLLYMFCSYLDTIFL